MTLTEQVELIETRADFVAFVRALLAELRARPGAWENGDLESYLEAMAAWVEDSDGYFRNAGRAVPEQPSWKLFGQILTAARVYE